MRATSLLEVDGGQYPVHFQGFHEPLHVWTRSGGRLALSPWTCGEHLRALGRHLRPEGEGLALDERAFCGEVLARCGVEPAQEEELAPLALWWAAGGGESQARPGPDGWLTLASCRIRLRPWTCGERLRAQGLSLRAGPGGGRSFDAGVYLAAMVEASVDAVEPPDVRVESLDAASTVALLDAMVALNVPGAWEEQLAGTEEAAAMTLRLCRELGWTPSQVWATPAPEVDLLLRLLDQVQGVRRPAPGRTPVPRAPSGPPRIADLPDAIVIQIEDEPA
jgi:hypothetical protein